MTSINPRSNEDSLKILLEWKKLYTESLVDALYPKGDVLEIGFGAGIAAKRIQYHRPKMHTILESNPQIIEEAKKWAAQKENIRIIEGKWETILPTQGTFDAIFFNDYPSEDDIAIMNFLFPEDTLKTSTEAKKLLSLLEEQMSHLTMKFSDQDIEDFYQNMGQFNSKEMPKFFQKLRDNGNISEMQYNDSIKKYNRHQETSKNSQPDLPKQTDSLLVCLEECLKNHMNKNGRFSSFLNNQISKYEDSKFFDNIITNPEIDYKESSVQINTSDKARDGIIMLVEKN